MSDVNKQLLEAVKAFLAAEKSEGREKLGHVYKPATREHQQRELVARIKLNEAIAAAEQVQQADIGKAISQQAEPVAYLKTAAGVMQLSFEGNPVVNVGADVEVQTDTVQPLYTHPPAVAVPALRQVRRAEDGMPSANYAEGFDHGWNDCVYEVRAMFAAAQKQEGVK